MYDPAARYMSMLGGNNAPVSRISEFPSQYNSLSSAPNLGPESVPSHNHNPVYRPPTDEEPLYVNAKQYHRILKRRQQRAKLEAKQKSLNESKVLYYFTLLSLICMNLAINMQ